MLSVLWKVPYVRYIRDMVTVNISYFLKVPYVWYILDMLCVVSEKVPYVQYMLDVLCEKIKYVMKKYRMSGTFWRCCLYGVCV